MSDQARKDRNPPPSVKALRFEPYDQQVLDEIAREQVQQPLLQKVISAVGKPAGRVVESAKNSNLRVVHRTATTLQDAIIKAQLQAIKFARNSRPESRVREAGQRLGLEIQKPEDFARLPLEKKDTLADSLIRGNTLLIGVEGALLGLSTSLAAYIPFAQVSLPGLITTDILLSMTLLARHAVQVALVYGYPGDRPEHIPHILAALAPEREFTDEGYLASKALVINAIRESAQFLSEVSSRELSLHVLQKRAPQLIKLMQYVAERIGLVLTEKQLSMGLPIAGAFLNGGINVAFQQLGHRTAKNYFRRLLLAQRYGAEAVQHYLQYRIEQLQQAKSNLHDASSPQPRGYDE